MSRAETITGAIRHRFANGLMVLIHRNPTSPIVSVRGEIQVGAVHEPAQQNGLAVFTAAALIRGAGSRSFQEIVTATESVGASVNAGGGMHTTGFGGRSLTEDLPLVLEILGDMIMRPTFPTQEVERLRSQILMGLREGEQEPRTQASRAARALLFPAEHPYSRLSGGSLASVEPLGRSDLLEFHRHYHPAATTIALVGDIEPALVLEQLEATFGHWQSAGGPPSNLLPTPNQLRGIQRQDIAMQGKSQSDVIWAVHGLARTSPDYYAASIANMILGRIGMGGRLGEHVREQQGLAYYCGSSMDADIGAGPWAALAGVNPQHVERAIAAILHEVAGFCAAGPTDEELSDARDFMTGSTVLSLETNDGIAGTLLGIERYDLGLDYIERYPAIIRSISAEQITDVARRYLSVNDCVITVAGPRI